MLNTVLGSLSSGVAASTTSYESIASYAPSSGSSVTFSSIPSTYKHLQIRWMAYSGVGVNLSLQFNGDTGNNYADHWISGDGSTASATAEHHKIE